MTTPRTTIGSRIDSWWKALGVIVAAVAVGVTAGMTLTSFLGLPARVDANAGRIGALEATTETARNEREEIAHGIHQLTCFWLADRRGAPIEDCLDPAPRAVHP